MSEQGAAATSVPSARRDILGDPRLQQAFSKEGWVTMPMLSEPEVEELKAAVAALRPDDGFDPGKAGGRAATYHCSFLDTNRDYRRRTFELLSRYFAAHVERVLVDFRIVQCNFYVKPAGTGNFGLHQNWPATADLDETTVSIWCPIVDASAHNGGISVVPGSHKILPHVQAPTTSPDQAPSTSSYFGGLEAELWSSGLVETLSVPAGSAVIFDDSLIHGSAANQSSEPRIAIQLICLPVESIPAYYRDLGDGRFEVVRADVDFWVENDMGELLNGKEDWEILGRVESENRPIDLKELRGLLARGDEIRKTSIRLKESHAKIPGRQSWLKRLMASTRGASA